MCFTYSAPFIVKAVSGRYRLLVENNQTIDMCHRNASLYIVLKTISLFRETLFWGGLSVPPLWLKAGCTRSPVCALSFLSSHPFQDH